MSCPNPVELSRALVVGIDDRLRAHLETCTRCSQDLDAHASVAADTRQLDTIEPSPDRAWNVRASLMAAARAPAPVPRSRFVWGFAAASALAAAAVLAFVLLKPEPSRRGEVAQAYRGTLLPHEGAALLRVASAPDEIVRLTNGTVSVKVATLEPGERFRVVTGDAEVDVRGTADVSVDRDHLRAVRVVYGRVEVRAYGVAPKLLQAGERWDVELASEGEAERAPVPAPVLDDIAIAEPSPAPIGPHSTRRASTRTKKHERAEQISAQQAPPPASPARPKRPIELLFEEGWSTLQAGNAAAAAGIFERAAESAPSDPLAEDAWFWRASSLSRAKSSSAASALDAFLAKYPRSPRVGEASAMLGWLIIDRDLDRAEKLFRAAEHDRVAAVRASAAKGLTAVAQHRKND